MALELSDISAALATGIQAADATGPIALNGRTGAPYQAGIGPHTERETLRLALAAASAIPTFTYALEVPYVAAGRSRCDLCVSDPGEWSIETKLLRMLGDNGKPNDNMLMHLLSPYPAHRSALTDCAKLLNSGLPGRKAIVVFGYDYADWPMDPAIDAFEALASRSVRLSARFAHSFEGLMHPVHQHGRVFAWELQS
jgi:hypothetical protein